MKLKRFEFFEEIGKGCSGAVIISALAVIVATGLQFAPSKELKYAGYRLALASMGVASLGWVGSSWANTKCLQMGEQVAREIEQARWESLNRVIEGKPYSIASCRNCKNLVGHIGSGNILICAMHPYGWESNDCPDKEER